MTTTFYRVRDESNFVVTHWVYESGDPFGFIHQLNAGHLVITPTPDGEVGFPTPPRQKPICTVMTFAPDGVTPAPDAPPTDFRIESDYWIVSDRLKRLLEAFDPGAFAFVEIEMRWGGWRESRPAWLARIVRSFETRDPTEVPAGAHAFLRSKNRGLSFFDEHLKNRILSGRMTGFGFRAVNKF